MEIKISKSARTCSACQRPFVHDQELNSVVRILNRTLVREDYCRDCWQSSYAVEAFSAWSLRFYDPKVAEQEPPDVFSPLRQLFYEAVESTNRREIAKAYLAAQLLKRQKVFRLIRESDDADGEERITLFADRIGNRLIEVRDPNLSYAELEEGRQDLLEQLAEREAPGKSQENVDDAQLQEA